MQLTLVVNNTDELDGGTKATAIFNEDGGVIGSLESANWVLSDRQGSVQPHHLSVHHIDGQFCLEANSGARVFVNGASTPVASGEMFQVTDGDTLQVGNFMINAYVTASAEEVDHSVTNGEAWAKRFVSVGTLVGDYQEQQISSQNLFDSEVMRRDNGGELRERLMRARKTDPIEMLEEQTSTRSTNLKDPIAALEREQKAESNIMASKVGEVLNIEPEEAHFVEVPDDLQPGSAYVAPPVIREAVSYSEAEYQDAEYSKPKKRASKASSKSVTSDDMDSYLEMLARSAKNPASEETRRVTDASVRDAYLGEMDDDELPEEELVDHVVLRPLCNALGLNIRELSMPQANRLAKDIGAALKAAISGLMDAHKRELSDKSHLAETHLHAIEDNPLRLDQSIEGAIKDLFLVQSPVHLSAEAAISESLELLQHHRAASEVATEAALDAILKALSPLALAKRFMKYKGHAPRSGDLDAWHWNMYQHYYAEMRSDQQGGLSRMFWEVYRQVYDREMRQRTMEHA